MNAYPIVEQLKQLGFRRRGNQFSNNGLRARLEPGWLTLRSPVMGKVNVFCDRPNMPGLWKHVRDTSGRLQRVFDVPLATIAGLEICDELTGELHRPLDAIINWARTTCIGKPLSDWKCPAREEFAETLPPQAFTVEVGQYARQCQLHCDGRRLAISVPILQRLTPDLASQRRETLKQLLTEVQFRSRLVRLVEMETSVGAYGIVAKVDLSGAPQFATTPLLRIGLDALRHVVSQTIKTVELIVDPAVTSTVLDNLIARECPAEGRDV